MEDRRRQHGGLSDAVTHTLLITCQIAAKMSDIVRHMAIRETRLFFNKFRNKSVQ